jgi:4-hydroxy-3-methylbut-2-enyl diphosphate reductase
VTAGASAPELLVEEVVAYLTAHGASAPVTDEGRKEHIVFPLPKSLLLS